MNYFPIPGVWIYLVKVILISGLLCGYYRLFLRNKLFHQYNRYYLLGITLVSLLLPVLPLPSIYPLQSIAHTPALSVTFHAIAPAVWNEPGETARETGMPSTLLNGPILALGIYLLTVAVLLYTFFRQLAYIRRLSGKYRREKMGSIDFFMTPEPGTPFSFLNLLFWNEKLNFDSDRGQQVFRHEWYHIQQRHTLDLLLLQIVRVLFWINPFFHWIYREIRTIHEFLADRHAVSGGDRYEYAELLVWHNIQNRPHPLTHPFFQSPIKRRITMLTQLTSRRSGYWSRTMVLPLAFLLFCAFAANNRLSPPVTHLSAPLSASLPPFTVVIDPGHGGIDPGAIAGDAKEKDINLALALKIKELSPEYHLNVILTRQTDELAGGKSSIRESLEYRSDLANKDKADLFVSIHMNNAAGKTPLHGFGVFVSPDNPYYTQSMQLGSALIDAVKQNYSTYKDLQQPLQRVYVLRHIAMPAVLVECGYIDNPDDLNFMSDGKNQGKIARDILQGIRRYEEGQAAAK